MSSGLALPYRLTMSTRARLVPPAVTTRTLIRPRRAVAGTLHVMLPALHDLKRVTFSAPNFTWLKPGAAPKRWPVMTITVPRRADGRESEARRGAGGRTSVNAYTWSEGSAAVCARQGAPVTATSPETAMSSHSLSSS